MENDLTFKSLGLTDYQDSYDAMKAHITKPNFENQIWLLEHPPVFTLGTAASKEHIDQRRTLKDCNQLPTNLKNNILLYLIIVIDRPFFNYY